MNYQYLFHFAHDLSSTFRCVHTPNLHCDWCHGNQLILCLLVRSSCNQQELEQKEVGTHSQA